MIYTPISPDWFYSYVDIPNVDKIITELTDYRKNNQPKIANNPYYVNYMVNNALLDELPALAEYFNKAGVLNKFDRMLYSSGGGASIKNTVHVDSSNPQYCMFSLNFPIEYCEGSYTVFYDTSNPELTVPEIYGQVRIKGMRPGFMDDQFLTVRAKVEAVRPVLVNTTILHNGVYTDPRRAICGLRFSSYLTIDEMIRLGIKDPLVQVD